jgi:hypothetical protein
MTAVRRRMIGAASELLLVIGTCLARPGDLVVVDLERACIVGREARARIDRLLWRLVMMANRRRPCATGSVVEGKARGARREQETEEELRHEHFLSPVEAPQTPIELRVETR